MGCYNTCIVNAPVEHVWAALRNFHDMSWATGVIESLDKIGDCAADQIGARRVLNGVFHETLLGINDVDRAFKYSIDDGPDVLARDQVSGYVGEVRVWPVADEQKTFVEWSSNWTTARGDVKALCDPIYVALLDALKSHFA